MLSVIFLKLILSFASSLWTCYSFCLKSSLQTFMWLLFLRSQLKSPILIYYSSSWYSLYYNSPQIHIPAFSIWNMYSSLPSPLYLQCHRLTSRKYLIDLERTKTWTNNNCRRAIAYTSSKAVTPHLSLFIQLCDLSEAVYPYITVFKLFLVYNISRGTCRCKLQYSHWFL